jgi:hypothetical protein
MPLIRIALIKGKPQEYADAIADGLQFALHRCFRLPGDDVFQIVYDYQPVPLVAVAEALGLQVGEETVLIHIRMRRPRDAAAQAAFYRTLLGRLAQRPGIPAEKVEVIFACDEGEIATTGAGTAELRG